MPVSMEGGQPKNTETNSRSRKRTNNKLDHREIAKRESNRGHRGGRPAMAYPLSRPRSHVKIRYPGSLSVHVIAGKRLPASYLSLEAVITSSTCSCFGPATDSNYSFGG